MRTSPELDPTPISSRRRWLILFLPALISLFGLIAVFIFQQQTVPSWQVRMEAYQMAEAERGNAFEVLAVVTALLPQEYGANEPFRPVDEVGSLPTPPQEVRCLDVRAEGSQQRRIMLMIRHTEAADPDDWVIYEASSSEDRINRSVAEIGCFFPDFGEE